MVAMLAGVTLSLAFGVASAVLWFVMMVKMLANRRATPAGESREIR